jgi:MFS family permease
MKHDNCARSISVETPTVWRHAPDWIVLTIACLAQFIVVLDVSIVNVALPSMQRDLHLSLPSAQWVVNAYVLTFAGSFSLAMLGTVAAERTANFMHPHSSEALVSGHRRPSRCQR